MSTNELSDEERQAALLAEADRILSERNPDIRDGDTLARWQKHKRRKLLAERRKLRKAGVKLPQDYS